LIKIFNNWIKLMKVLCSGIDEQVSACNVNLFPWRLIKYMTPQSNMPIQLLTHLEDFKMLTSSFVTLLVGITSVSPLQTRASYAVKETHPVPHQWTRVSAAPADHIIKLQIGLKQSQFDELERHLYEGMPPPLPASRTILTLRSLRSGSSSLWSTSHRR
jgi:hypothetical protein